jgi:DNA-binding XRE family transcriptional regulator
MTAGNERMLNCAEALVRTVGLLEREIDALLDTDCARPSLIPPALVGICSAPPSFAAAARPSAPEKRRRSARVSRSNTRGSEIGQRIREARAAIGMTQLELATATGIRRPNVARLERGRNTPTIETLQRVADALGVSVASLVSGA